MDKSIVNLYRYDVLVPPFQLDYDNWVLSQAYEYKDWFVENMHERAEYVIKKSGVAKKQSANEWVASPEILIKVWKWFRSIVKYEPVPSKELEEQRSQFARFGENFITKKRLTVLSKLIIQDIAMLLSVMLTNNYSCLYWDVVRKPKNHIWINRPVIKGFIDANPDYPKPFDASFQPVHMVKVQAAKIPDSESSDTDLFDLYNYWINLVPIV